MRESDVEGYLRKRVKETGGEHRKCTWSGRRGAPDDFCMWPFDGGRPGFHGWVECKKPGEEPTAQQEREHQRMIEAGCSVWVIDSKDQVDNYIAFVMEKIGDR